MGPGALPIRAWRRLALDGGLDGRSPVCGSDPDGVDVEGLEHEDAERVRKEDASGKGGENGTHKKYG